MFHPLLASAVAVMLMPAVGESAFKAGHNMTEAQYQTWINSLGKEKLHPIQVSVYGTGGDQRFAAIAVDTPNSGWIARHGLTSEAYQKEFAKQSADGYRLISISGYTHNNAVNYAALWVKDSFKGGWEGHHGQTAKEYQATFDAAVKKGMRPLAVVGYQAENTHHIASIFINDGKGFNARHDMTAEQYQKMFDELNPKGYHPDHVSAYPTENGTRFSAVFLLDKATPRIAKHGLTGAEYQKLFDEQAAKGNQPIVVCGYGGSDHRFACIFADLHVARYPLPMSGTAVASLKSFDDAMQKFMKERSIQAGTLAVTRDGKIVLSRGYGYNDHDLHTLTGPVTPMRIASVVKPLTLAALLKLIREGKISADTKVVTFLGITAPTGQTMDKRWNDITIQHLIDHKGGWDRGKAGDPMFKSPEIAKALGKTGPATADDIIKYMAGQPLQFNPGASPMVYSNFGYCLLGRVIEKASGKKYIDYLRSDILNPLGITSVKVGSSLTNGRDPKEPVYIDPGMGNNVVNPSSKVQVPAPDGTFHIEAMDSHGGLIASAPDLAKFLMTYWIDGQPRKAGVNRSFNFFGSLPGTHSLVRQRNDGVNIVALFNQRADASKLDYNLIDAQLNQAADSITSWPK